MVVELGDTVTFKSYPYDNDDEILEFSGMVENISPDKERILVSYVYKGRVSSDWIPVNIIESRTADEISLSLKIRRQE